MLTYRANYAGSLYRVEIIGLYRKDRWVKLRPVDVVIVGAGVIGSAVAWKLARYDLDIVVVDKESDVACGTSKANSGIVHAGYHDEPDTLMAKLCVEGNAMMWKLARELDIPHRQTGSLVVAYRERDIAILGELKERGKTNGVTGLEILDRNAVRELEPNLHDSACAALFAPSAGVIAPYELTIGLAENAADNGVSFMSNALVTAIEKRDEYLAVKTTKGELVSHFVLNCAGTSCDLVGEMIGDDLSIILRKGEEYILDKSVGDIVNHVIFPVPTPESKGILVAPTADGNLLIGPTAVPATDRTDLSTTLEGLQSILDSVKQMVPNISPRDIITSYAGIRAVPISGDFVIKASENLKGLIHVGGICSPGLTAAPAIAEMVSVILSEHGLQLVEKTDHNPLRTVPRFRDMSHSEREALIAKDPTFAKIVCRCETVTEGEIRDAITRPLGATTLDGIKKRTRSGMGRCQGGFCLPKVAKILAEEMNIPVAEVVKDSPVSKAFSCMLGCFGEGTGDGECELGGSSK